MTAAIGKKRPQQNLTRQIRVPDGALAAAMEKRLDGDEQIEVLAEILVEAYLTWKQNG